MATPVKAKAKTQSNPNDIYTALLGLAFLALAGTTGVACYWSYQMFGSIF